MYYEKANVYITNDKKILFDLNKYDIYEIDDETFNLFEEIYFEVEKGVLFDENINESTPKKKEIYELLFRFRNYNSSGERETTQIRIHTSNECNLKCKYCYANHGDYNQGQAIMTEEIAEKVADFIKLNFPKVKVIVFFGGEPLLGFKAIGKICEKMGKETHYIVNTNLTILNEEIIKLINEYSINVTGSIDGPKEIHDLNRVYKRNGRGSFDIVRHNARKLMEETEYFDTVDAVYTLPAQKKYSKHQIAEYLYKEFKVKYIAIGDVITEDETLKVEKEKVQDIEKEVEYVFDNIIADRFIYLNEYSLPLISFFSKSYNDNFCTTGISNITITASGDIWPCQLFIGRNEYHMGKIDFNDITNFDFKKFNKVSDNFYKIKKSRFSECQKCIARYWCVKCLGAIQKNNLEENIITSECINIRKITEIVLEKLGYYILNGNFEKLYGNLRKTTKGIEDKFLNVV
ncbi:radical SAM protein [Thermoanaerobacter sp. CM-CNRG TB177]|jgi:uncharacterized protein|uniref:radical SAM/SPASM domain-containing protein n=1 Tax=unclassified Thermoanaerobacter TaxID=2636821 RepID=UPI0000E1DEAE|nr:MULTISPECIES: radical SAM protein [unclassified Thermoanaerobacter]KUJ89918.1 MAG: Radical SAM domain-containing protein [Thermoanaerobacter thermocopriae]KUK35111.1 MAG: Radical SAM domain protein [Caldanaerobacter subterraneus]MDI3501863.1 uncharacterized protein [Thermoanaerobacter sp.]ABY92654.1 Radical SAM domain protein [Thermoanaerobacter sp. X514]MBT1279368.1 radical SAM protein [Thermoanaerobacter sp. CM-CNRG TB177]